MKHCWCASCSHIRLYACQEGKCVSMPVTYVSNSGVNQENGNQRPEKRWCKLWVIYLASSLKLVNSLALYGKTQCIWCNHTHRHTMPVISTYTCWQDYWWHQQALRVEYMYICQDGTTQFWYKGLAVQYMIMLDLVPRKFSSAFR